MPLSLQYDPATSLCELRVEGTLKRSEFASCEQELAKHISAGAQPRVLVILDQFGDWEKNEDWDNLDFMFSHGEKIAKIAIVGAGDKEAEVKAFSGAGMRKAPVEFFPTGQQAEARAWLLS